MSNTGQGFGATFAMQPAAYDPIAQPELFEGVLGRRMMAFLIDVLFIAVPLALLAFFITLFGVLTLGLGFFLFFVYGPICVIWALLYYGMTLGSPRSATLGMRVMDIEMRTFYGGKAYFLLGAVHAILYWVSVSFLTPLVLFIALFNARRRMLHDMALGTVVVNNEVRAAALRGTRRF